jgi:Virulence protein
MKLEREAKASLFGHYIEVRIHDENVWLSQKGMAQLFDCSADNISLHLKNIFEVGELAINSVAEESSATATDGKKYKTKFYKYKRNRRNYYD